MVSSLVDEIENSPVVVYCMPNCPPCQLMMNFLDENEIKYCKVDITKNSEIRFKKGITHAPVCHLKHDNELFVIDGYGLKEENEMLRIITSMRMSLKPERISVHDIPVTD